MQFSFLKTIDGQGAWVSGEGKQKTGGSMEHGAWSMGHGAWSMEVYSRVLYKYKYLFIVKFSNCLIFSLSLSFIPFPVCGLRSPCPPPTNRLINQLVLEIKN